jgi:predicted RNA binding protein YcfA (HicA-like mRNA interferase family)
MPKLPTTTGKEAVNAFAKIGFVLTRICGSHHILKREGHRYLLSVPVHGNKPVKPGTLRSLIRDAEITVEDFVGLL